MPGTIAGAMKARDTNKKRYGKDFYKVIGRSGGSALKTSPAGFASMTPEARKALGSKGGRMSRRNRQP